MNELQKWFTSIMDEYGSEILNDQYDGKPKAVHLITCLLLYNDKPTEENLNILKEAFHKWKNEHMELIALREPHIVIDAIKKAYYKYKEERSSVTNPDGNLAKDIEDILLKYNLVK